MMNPQEALKNAQPPIYTGSLPKEVEDMFDPLQDSIIGITEGSTTVASMYDDKRFEQRVFIEIEGNNPNIRMFQFKGTEEFCCLVTYELNDKGQILVHCNELNDVVVAFDGKPPHLLTCFDRAFAQHPEPNIFAEPALLSPKDADSYFVAALKRLAPSRPPALRTGGNSISLNAK